MNTITDNDIMELVKDGELSQMSLLFDRHNRNLFGYFYRLTGNGMQSEDMMQNVFYRMLKYKHTYRSENKFVFWMYAIARNVFKEHYRKKDALAFSSDLETMENRNDENLNIEQQWVKNDRQKLLTKAMQCLVPEQREAIILSKYHGLKYGEIAKLSDVTENAIKARIRRGLMELRRILDQIEAQ